MTDPARLLQKRFPICTPHIWKMRWVALALSITLSPSAALAGPQLPPVLNGHGTVDKTVVIRADTKVVDVFENQVVRFKVGSKEFTLNFSGNNVYYDLQNIAPPGIINRKIKINVGPNPKYHNQGLP